MKKLSPFCWILILVLCTGIVLLSCTKKEKVTIAIMTKLESGSIVGSSEVNAARMFLEEHNIDNIELVPFDDAWKPEKAKEAYAEIKKRGIKFLITSHVSTCAMAIVDDINKDGILTFVTGATTDLLSGKDDFILRNIQDVAEEQRSIAEYINTMPGKRLLIIRDTDNHGYGVPALKYLKPRLAKDKVRVMDISISKLDLTSLEQRMKREDFDLLYLLIGGYKSVAGSIGQLAHKLRPTAKILYTPWMKTPALLETAGGSIKNSVIPSHYPPHKEAPQIQNYMERFKKRFNYAPTFISLNVYAALSIMTEAISAGNRTPEKVKAYIINKGKFDTEVGRVTFDKYGDTRMRLFFITGIPDEF